MLSYGCEIKEDCLIICGEPEDEDEDECINFGKKITLL